MPEDITPVESPSRDKTTVDAEWLGKWLEAIHKQQQEQTKQLRNISTAASFIIVFSILAIIGTLLSTCS